MKTAWRHRKYVKQTGAKTSAIGVKESAKTSAKSQQQRHGAESNKSGDGGENGSAK